MDFMNYTCMNQEYAPLRQVVLALQKQFWQTDQLLPQVRQSYASPMGPGLKLTLYSKTQVAQTMGERIQPELIFNSLNPKLFLRCIKTIAIFFLQNIASEAVWLLQMKRSNETERANIFLN